MTDDITRSIGESIALVNWPADDVEVSRLRAVGRPRLYLVEAGSPPPVTTDVHEDWIRLPASEEDLHARSVALAARSARVAVTEDDVPSVRDGRIVSRNKWVALSPIEESILAELVGQFGEVVPLTRLTGGLDGHDLTANAVRVHVMRLRKRIGSLGLAVRTVHGRGYLIEIAS